MCCEGGWERKIDIIAREEVNNQNPYNQQGE